MTNTLGVVKVGYSTNDPDERVKDWASATGAPGTAKVEYAVWAGKVARFMYRRNAEVKIAV